MRKAWLTVEEFASILVVRALVPLCYDSYTHLIDYRITGDVECIRLKQRVQLGISRLTSWRLTTLLSPILHYNWSIRWIFAAQYDANFWHNWHVQASIGNRRADRSACEIDFCIGNHCTAQSKSVLFNGDQLLCYCITWHDIRKQLHNITTQTPAAPHMWGMLVHEVHLRTTGSTPVPSSTGPKRNFILPWILSAATGSRRSCCIADAFVSTFAAKLHRALYTHMLTEWTNSWARQAEVGGRAASLSQMNSIMCNHPDCLVHRQDIVRHTNDKSVHIHHICVAARFWFTSFQQRSTFLLCCEMSQKQRPMMSVGLDWQHWPWLAFLQIMLSHSTCQHLIQFFPEFLVWAL